MRVPVVLTFLARLSMRSSASSRVSTLRGAAGRKLYHCSIGMAQTSVVLACIMRR